MAGHFAKTCRWRKSWVPVEAMRYRMFCMAWGQIGLAVVLIQLGNELMEQSADVLQGIGLSAMAAMRTLDAEL